MSEFSNAKRYGFIALGMLIAVIMILLVSVDQDPESGLPDNPLKNREYAVYPVHVPDNLRFAGEKVPLQNFDIRESLDREMLVNVYWQSHTMLLIKRAHRYFPVIEPILEEHGVPSDFKYIAVAESELMNVVSPSHAVGFWQILRGTARDYGLEVNAEVDERYHLEKATAAACRFLKDSHEKYGSWVMAAASYNMGRNALTRQIRRQGTGNYYDLLLNDETGRYVYRLIALKLILSNPEDYGFFLDREDLYPPIPTYEVTVDSPVKDLADFALRYGVNYKILKYFNPWLRSGSLTNAGSRIYYIKIPRSGFRDFSMDPEDFEEEASFK